MTAETARRARHRAARAFPPAGLYVGAVRTGDLLFLSGRAGPRRRHVVTGKVGRDVDADDAASPPA